VRTTERLRLAHLCFLLRSDSSTTIIPLLVVRQLVIPAAVSNNETTWNTTDPL